MKLIIDISEGDYAPFKFGKYIIVGGLRGNGKTLMSAIYKAIANATPLEKHDEEIIKETVESIWGKPCADAISRQAVDELSKELVHTTRDKADFLCNFWERLQKLPSAYPQNTDVLDKIKAEIERYQADCNLSCSDDANCRICDKITFDTIYRIIDKYRGERNEQV